MKNFIYTDQGLEEISTTCYRVVVDIPCGHNAIAHKSINDVGWDVTHQESGRKIGNGRTKKLAVENANQRLSCCSSQALVFNFNNYTTNARSLMI